MDILIKYKDVIKLKTLTLLIILSWVLFALISRLVMLIIDSIIKLSKWFWASLDNVFDKKNESKNKKFRKN